MDSPLRAVWLLVLISNEGGAETEQCQTMITFLPGFTLNADVDNSREASSNSICSLAQVISFTRLLDIFQNQRSVNHFHIGLNLSVQVSVILWFVSWHVL